MKKYKELFYLLAVIIVIGCTAAWYQSLTHFDRNLTEQARKSLKKQDYEFLYKSELKKVKSLDIEDASELKCLPAFKNLEYVTIDLCKVDVDDLNKYLAHIPELMFRKCKITGQEKVCNLPEVKKLHIRALEITDKTFLTGFTGLELLEYTHTEADDIKTLNLDLSFLMNTPHLQELRLEAVKCSNVSVLNGLKELKAVLLSGESLEKEKDPITSDSITWLCISNMKQNGFERIVTIPNLNELVIDVQDEKVLDIQSLSKAKKLEHLCCWGKYPVVDGVHKTEGYDQPRLKGVGCLEQMKQLKEINLDGTNVDLQFMKTHFQA